MQWYYKAGLIFGLLWAAARALGAAGDAQRDLDINFLFGFMLTVGGWSAVFLVVDWVLRFTGLRKVPATVTGSGPGGSGAGQVVDGGVEPESTTPAAVVATTAAPKPPGAATPTTTGSSGPQRRRSRR